jgi:flagellar capping protein FliD
MLEEIEARIEKINKEYKKNIYPLVVGEFKNQIETEIKGYKNQVENLRSQFKDMSDDILKLKEKHHTNLDTLSTL